MSFQSHDTWWWPFLFILVAGWAATDVWRFLGVYLGGRISEESDWLVLVRTMATSLVAAVIGNLIVFPGGALAETPLWLRIGAAALGFLAYLGGGRRVWIGIAAAEVVLCSGLYFGI